jgi:antitoxin (DNA-binding transcriptional repressor) of toxin-antitoxin stability system
METVPIEDLKRRLSTFLSAAREGMSFLITRHRKPVACLAPPGPLHVHRGPKVGRVRLVPLLRQASGGRYLDFLEEDRRGGTEI